MAPKKNRPKTRNRLLLYVAISVLTSTLGGISLAMFGDGTFTWAEFRMAWALFVVKTLLDAFITVRAFIDNTPSDEKEEQRVEAFRAPPQPPLIP